MRKEFYGILPLALTSCLASQATAQEKQTQRPNVVLSMRMISVTAI